MHISYIFNYDAIRDAKSRTLALQYRVVKRNPLEDRETNVSKM